MAEIIADLKLFGYISPKQRAFLKSVRRNYPQIYQAAASLLEGFPSPTSTSREAPRFETQNLNGEENKFRNNNPKNTERYNVENNVSKNDHWTSLQMQKWGGRF